MNDYFLNLHHARTHHDNGDFEGAVAFCVKAIAENPDDSRVYTQHGVSLSSLGLFEEARRAFAKARSLEPEDPFLIDNHANILKQLGRFEEAAEEVEKAMAIDRHFAPAYYTLSSIRRFSPDDPVIEKFEALKKKTAGNDLFQSLMCFALGKIYDDIGEWDQAFENYAEGNRLANEPYDKDLARNRFDGIKRVFTRSLIDRFAGAGDPSSKPVFIVGMPRCGSSLIEEMLSRSTSIHGLGERIDIAKLVSYVEHTHQQLPAFPDLMGTLNSGEFAQCGDLYLQSVSRHAPEAERLLDKNLLNFPFVGFIKLILPQASIIHAMRDPIDICLSCFFQKFTHGHKYSFDLSNIARQYAAYDGLMKHWYELFGAEIFSASYERMIEDKDASIKGLFDHIGMTPPGAEILEAPAERAIPTASAWQARQPIYKTSVKRWKNYEKHLGPLFKALEEAGFDYTKA